MIEIPVYKNVDNLFETPKDIIDTFEGVKVKVGSAFAIQF